MKTKERVIYALALFVGLAVILAIVGDYWTAYEETKVTREPVEVSSEVMTLVQTALGGLIGIIGGYFGAKGSMEEAKCDCGN
jgi:uncharacterized membrane protein YfcA